ncbi:MFS transporter [Alkalithermobacter paradoxus]|uniref:Putative MFS-type transporter YcaD n=1 Tax=Alkalithermobacter paradoxus TaxID=29349 RepID=A0A1V4IAZ8_9FIRM|nr:putative MFS-type transporter YcaD [[Clostridium] thermoalcaliphilum]
MYTKNIRNYLISSSLIFLTFGCFSNFLSIHLKLNNFTDSFIGTILSMQTFGTAIGSIVAGILLKKYSFKANMLFSTLLITISCILTASSLHKYILLPASLTLGLGMAFQFVIESPYLMKITSRENRVNMFSLSFCIKNFSMMLGTLSAGFISDINVNTQHTLLFFGIMSILSVLPIIKIDNIKTNSENSSSKQSPNIFRNTHLVKIVVFNALIGIGAGLVVPFFSVYIKHTLSANNKIVGILLSMSQLGIVLGGLSIPYLSKSLGKIKTVIFCQALSIPFLLSISISKNITIIAISFFMRTALMNMAQPLVQSVSMEVVDEKDMSMFSSFIVLISNVFRAVGTFIGGQIIHITNYDFPYYITSILYIFAIILFYNTFKNYYYQPNNALQ